MVFLVLRISLIELPEGLPFFNGLMKKSTLRSLVHFVHLRHGTNMTVELVDKLKDVGFLAATRAGVSIGIDERMRLRAYLARAMRPRAIAPRGPRAGAAREATPSSGGSYEDLYRAALSQISTGA